MKSHRRCDAAQLRHQKHDPAQPEHLGATSQRIRELVMGAMLPAEVRQVLECLARDLLPQSGLAVRSSAIGEDGVQSSFAGQFDSILGVTTTTELKDAVRAC